jgi:cobyrinic acid a,c-diamide synthase
MPHLYIAAAHKSSGKTTLSVGLAAAIKAGGKPVQPFKKGPDYIDPIWLSRAAGQACYNLDFFTQSKEEIHQTFSRNLQAGQIGLIEGNKGLFDGMDVKGSDSNAALATMLGAPVILVIDTSGITRGIAPLVQGYLGFDDQVNIAGVILNKVGGARHERKLRHALEEYTDIGVLGALGRDRGLEIPERHLGLIPANESGGNMPADEKISQLSNAVARSVDIERVIQIADTAIPSGTDFRESNGPIQVKADIKIAIARDQAFGFYYQDDLDAFKAAGASLVPFNALRSPRLPDVDGLFIGGGFPEAWLKALSANTSLLESIRTALQNGMPAYAECGGLMYLTRSIRWRGEHAPMAGFIPADTVVGERPKGRGYMLLEETVHHPWPSARTASAGSPEGTPVHEFHHAYLENLPGNSVFAQQVLRGTGIDGHSDGLVINNLMAGFAHQRQTNANPWVDRFVEFVRRKKLEAS